MKALLQIDSFTGSQALFNQLDDQVAQGPPFLGRTCFEVLEKWVWKVKGGTHEHVFA